MNGQTRSKAVLTLAVVTTASLVLTTLSTNAGETQLISALDALRYHVQGTTPLSASQIAAHKSTIDSNRGIFGNSSTSICPKP